MKWWQRLVRGSKKTIRNPTAKDLTRRAKIGVDLLEDRVVPSVVTMDLTARGSQVTVNGAIFKQADPQPTGTGVIRSFVRIQAQGSNQTVEQGYNTDYRPVQFDEKANPNFDRSIRLSE